MSSKVDTFLAGYSDSVCTISQALRIFMASSAPGCSETLHAGWKVISYGHTKKFCAISPHSQWVNLQFHSGASLDDNDALLQGSGKSMRHVKISETSQINQALSELVHQAAILAK